MKLKDINIIRWSNGFKYSKSKIEFTDKEWQERFNLLKVLAVPSKDKILKGNYYTESHSTKDENKYLGMTNWQSYCSFINDVLLQIRLGRIDYCYYTYQIEDLLKFEKDRLRTKYHPEDKYWEVWLDI